MDVADNLSARETLTSFDATIRAEAESYLAQARARLKDSPLALMVFDFRADNYREVFIAGAFAALRIWRDIDNG